MSNDKERESFEVWAAPLLGDNPAWRESGPCELAWQAWQARASLAASAGTDCARCSGSGEDPEGFYDQSRGDAGHTHDGPCRECSGSGVAASAGGEPVAEVVPCHTPSGKRVALCSDAQGLPIGTALYTHPSPPEGMVGGWRPIETAPEGKLVVVGWLDPDDAEHSERHDFDYLEDGCWMKWHEHAEHVEVIGGHGVSYTPPYTCWMPFPPIAGAGSAPPPPSAEGVSHG